MEVVFSKASFFKSFVKAFDKVVSEFLFVCDKDGITYAGMDASQVAIVAFQLAPDVFKRYICRPTTADKRTFEIGVSQRLLSQFLQIIPDESCLAIQDTGERLKLFVERGEQDGVEWRSDLSILDLQKEFHDLPGPELYKARIAFPSKSFAACIKDLSNIGSDHVTVRLEPSTAPPRPVQPPSTEDATQSTLELFNDNELIEDFNTSSPKGTPAKLVIEGSSATGKVSTTFLAGVDGVGVWESAVTLEQSFPLNFLRDHAVKFASLCSTMFLSLGGAEVPLELKFPLSSKASVAGNAGLLRFAGPTSSNSALSAEELATFRSVSFVSFHLGSLVRQSNTSPDPSQVAGGGMSSENVPPSRQTMQDDAVMH